MLIWMVIPFGIVALAAVLVGLRRGVGAAVLGAAAVAWLSLDGRVHSPQLVEINRHQGLSVADLGGLAALLIAGLLALRLARRAPAIETIAVTAQPADDLSAAA